MLFKRINALSGRSLVNILFSLSIMVSCSDDSDSKPSFDEYEYAATLIATIASDESPSTSEGFVTVDDNEAEIAIELMAGSMTGTVEQTAEGYTFTITGTTGRLTDVINITGAINTTTGALTFSGTNPGGSSITATAQATPILLSGDGFDDNLKAAAIFTHSEPGLIASITINGVTVDGVNAYHLPGGRCDSHYDLGNSIKQNYDDKTVSELFCHSGTIKGLDGNPLEFTDCSTVRFVLDKNEDYAYTVEWSNGDVTNGTFTTPGGGQMVAVCPKSSSGGTGGSNCGNASNTVKIDGGTFAVTSRTCGTGNGIFGLFGEGNDFAISIGFSSKPTKKATFDVIDDSGGIPAGKASISVWYGQDGEWHSKGGGKVTVTIVNGKIQADFCDVPMDYWDESKTTTIAGKVVCE